MKLDKTMWAFHVVLIPFISSPSSLLVYPTDMLRERRMDAESNGGAEIAPRAAASSATLRGYCYQVSITSVR